MNETVEKIWTNKCKICGDDCSWRFCDACAEMIGQGVDELQAQLADLKGRVAEYEAMLDGVIEIERGDIKLEWITKGEWRVWDGQVCGYRAGTFKTLLAAYASIAGKGEKDVSKISN